MSEQTAPAPAVAVAVGGSPAVEGSAAGANWLGDLRNYRGRQLGLIAGAAAILAIVAAGLIWADRSTYHALYSSLDDADAAAVVESLKAAGVPYQIDKLSGMIRVPAESVHEARFTLAAQGLPRGAGAGFDFLRNPDRFGSSQFNEQARYRHALEQELARSISSIGTVRSARVHLAIPARSAFARERRAPSASVVLQLQAGRILDDSETSAITHLVASSIPGLAVGRISVIDQLGRLMSGGQGKAGMSLQLNQLEYARRLEEGYVQRVEQILSPIVGPGRVRAQAVADVDFSVVDRTEETYGKGRTVLRSEQYSGPSAVDAVASGVPGALSNDVPADKNQGDQNANAGGDANEVTGEDDPTIKKVAPSRWTRNFEVDKEVSRTQVPIGRIRRLSVAVVIDDSSAAIVGENADATTFSPEEIERLTGLVRDAVGFNAERGDSVKIVNSKFLQAELDALQWYEQPWLLGIGKLLMITIIAIIVIFVIIRPLLRELLKHFAARRVSGETGLALAGGGAGVGGQFMVEGGGRDLLESAGSAMRLSNALPAHVAMLGPIRAARTLAMEDPRRSAHVLRRWLNEDE